MQEACCQAEQEGTCAHREDGFQVVEQLDVLRDPRAGPADQIVLAAKRMQERQETRHCRTQPGARDPALSSLSRGGAALSWVGGPVALGLQLTDRKGQPRSTGSVSRRG